MEEFDFSGEISDICQMILDEDNYDFYVEGHIERIRREVIEVDGGKARRVELKRCLRHFATLGFCQKVFQKIKALKNQETEMAKS